MAKYRKRPVIIDAILWSGDNIGVVTDFMNHHNAIQDENNGLSVHTLEGTTIASVGDWIIRGVQGEFYPCKPDIFAATYEPVGE